MEGHDKGYEKTLVGLFFLSWGFIFLDRLCVSFLLPTIVPIMNISNTQVGQIGFVTTGAYALSAIIFGALSDKSGYKKSWLIPFVFATAIFSGLSAATQNFTQLLIIRALVGAAEGPILPLMMAMLASASTKNTFGRNSGIVNSGVAIIAVTLGPIFITQVLAITTWQMAFLLASLPTFLLALALIKYSKEIYLKPDQDKKGGSGYIVEALKYKNIVICILIGIMSMAGYWTLMLFASLYWVEVGKVSVQTMGILVSAMGFVCMAWAVIIPKLSDDFGRKPLVFISYILCVLAPLLMFFLPGSVLTMAFYILFAGIPGCMHPLYGSVIPIETVPEHLRVTVTGLILGVAEVTGGAIFPLIAGSIADSKGLPFMMLIAAGTFFVAMLLSSLLKETNPRKVDPGAEISA